MIKEAVVPGFLTGKTDGFFIAKYFSARRQKAQNVKKQFPDLWKYPKHDGMVQAFIIGKCHLWDITVIWLGFILHLCWT